MVAPVELEPSPRKLYGHGKSRRNWPCLGEERNLQVSSPQQPPPQSCKTRAQPLLGWTEQDQGLQANGVCNCQTIPLQSYQATVTTACPLPTRAVLMATHTPTCLWYLILLV